MTKLSEKKMENMKLQDRKDCLDIWVKDYTKKISHLAIKMGSNLAEVSQILNRINEDIIEQYKCKQILKEVKELRENIKTSNEFWTSKANKMTSPNYKWEELPNKFSEGILTDEMVISYIGSKFGIQKALSIKSFLKI